MQPMNCHRFTWNQFELAVEDLAEKLRPYASKRIIYGQPRGGVCLAVALSHELGIPYTATHRGHDKLIWVDDVINTGDTYTKCRMIMPLDTIYCAWVSRQTGTGAYVHMIDPSPRAIVFPWERMEPENQIREVKNASYSQ